MKQCYVYILFNKRNGTTYTGVTSNLEKRVWEHKNKAFPDSFTSKYNCDKLIYYEESSSIKSAIQREKQFKEWQRKWKNEMIDKANPDWKDLSKDWL